MARASGILTMHNSKGTVYAITANALAVLVVTLVNFILFVKNKKDFDIWCIGTSVDYVEYEYSLVNNDTAIPQNRLSNTQDIYNCDRLFYDEVKWSLLCLVIMWIVYVSPYEVSFFFYYCVLTNKKKTRSIGFLLLLLEGRITFIIKETKVHLCQNSQILHPKVKDQEP